MSPQATVQTFTRYFPFPWKSPTCSPIYWLQSLSQRNFEGLSPPPPHTHTHQILKSPSPIVGASPIFSAHSHPCLGSLHLWETLQYPIETFSGETVYTTYIWLSFYDSCLAYYQKLYVVHLRSLLWDFRF